MPELAHFKRWLYSKGPRHRLARSNGRHVLRPPTESGAEQPPSNQAAAAQPLPHRLPDALPPGFTPEMMRRLERQLLFVVGCARSGTTALTRALNRSPELLLLEEPNFFAHYRYREFTAFFNGMHRAWGTPRMKGTYVRPPVEPEAGPLPMLARLAEEYRYVGSKTAFGPHEPGNNWRDAFVDYQAKYFFHARRVLITRAPLESIWSMHKMFADRPLPWLIATWLKSAAACIDCYRVFPGVRWMLFENLSAESVARFAATIPLEIEVPPSMLARSYVQSTLGESEMPAPLEPYARACQRCAGIYRMLRDNLSSESLMYCGQRSEWDFFDDLLGRITETLAELPPD